MRLIIFISLSLLTQSIGIAQPFAGNWKGQLTSGANEISLAFKIIKKGNYYFTSMDIPSQGVRNMRAEETEVKAKKIRIQFQLIEAEFTGFLKDTNYISGNWNQSGKSFPLTLKKIHGELFPKKPQTPKKPFPYVSENISFGSNDGKIKFSGTFTRPDCTKRHPAIILITGSGSQDRDETIGQHKPFAVIADHLSRNGMAVLRCDDRGVGGTIVHPKLMDSFTTEDLANDVIQMVRYLKSRTDVDSTQIGLLGHSEGGVIAPMVMASLPEIRFQILLAPVIVQGKVITRFQNFQSLKEQGYSRGFTERFLVLHDSLVEVALGITDEQLFTDQASVFIRSWKKQTSKKHLKEYSRLVSGSGGEKNLINQYYQFHQPWWRFILKYRPNETLEKCINPTYILFGEKDIQVEAASNNQAVTGMIKEKKGPKDITSEIIKGANHLFQTCEKCTVSEYFSLDTTIEPLVLDKLTLWLKARLTF